MAAGTDAVPAHPAWHEGRYTRWLTTSDHKAVGSLYIWTSFLFGVLAGIAYLILRSDTAPVGGVNGLFSVQLAAFVFLVLVPLVLGLALFVVPLQIGARGIVAPQLAAFAYWLYAFAGLTLVLTYYEAGTGDCGWSCNGTLTSTTGDTGDLWLLTLSLLAGSALVLAAILIATVSSRSAPGMTPQNRAPFTRAVVTFSWLTIASAALTVVVAVLLLLARHGNVTLGADTIRHLTWTLGMPQAVLLLIPAGAVVVEVWNAAHATGGRHPETALLLAVGAVLTAVGGLGGALVLTAFNGRPFDLHYAVAVADYVALSFVVIALFAGLWYWWPKLFGRLLGEELGSTSAWLIVIGVNLAFFPAYLASAKQDYLYPHFSSWDMFARVSMLGAGVFAVGVLLFLLDVLRTHRLRHGARAGNDPWSADTLEWLTTSPPPPDNFDRLPPIASARPLRDLRLRLESRG